MRIGLGYDVHPFERGRPLILGGIRIPADAGLRGHSDADVLLHAICDALLGAAAMGDIGTHFPDTDPTYKDADSRELLSAVVERVECKGFRVVNIDATVAIEQPRLRPHVAAMKDCIAHLLNVSEGSVSVKATTSERMGFVGRRQGVAAWAVCLLEDS